MMLTVLSAAFSQPPEAVLTRFMFCRAANLAGQQVTSRGRSRPLSLECLFRRQTEPGTGTPGTPRPTQARPILPVADGLRQVREPCGTGSLPRRQPAHGNSSAAAPA